MVQSLNCLPLWDTKKAKSICNGSRNRVGETHAEGNSMSIRPFGLFINGRRASFIRPDHGNMRKPRVNTPLWYQVLIDLGIDIRCLKVKDSRKDRYSAPVCAKQCGNQSANKAHDKPESHEVPPPHDHTSAADTARRRAPRPETVGLSQHACKLR